MLRALLLCSLCAAAFAQSNESWRRPYPAHKIAGNLYYVGTEDLACFLIATPQGHILVNSGLDDSTPQIRASIEKVGYRLEDIKILLTMQAHFDHTAALAEIQQLSGAAMYATPGDRPVLEDGGKSDTIIGVRNGFRPIKVSRTLKDGDTIRLGGTELKVILTPGHTKGSVSYSMTVNEGGKKYNVLLANISTVVMPLVGNSYYPNIVEDYQKTFRVQKLLKPDIWVAAHGSQYGMQAKHKAGSFVDPDGYLRAVEESEKRFQQQLAEQKKK